MRIKPSPSEPKADPGAKPTPASSMRRRTVAAEILHALNFEEHIESPGWHFEPDLWKFAQEVYDEIAIGARLGDLFGDEIFARIKRRRAADLEEGRRAAGSYWMIRSIGGPNSFGACSQPTRQPVIAQFLEKVLARSNRSSVSQISRKEGARAPSPPA